MIPVYVTDIISEVVSSAKVGEYNKTGVSLFSTIYENERQVIGSSLINTINYQFGHRMELIETLKQMDENPNNAPNRFPLVYLVQDFVEDRGKAAGFYADLSLNIIIAHQTKRDYKITDRMAKVFKPVLYPIYYQLLEYLYKHPLIHVESPYKIPHKKIDRSYWGRTAVGGNTANALNDFVDAIEIENLQLKINYKNGC